MNARTIRRAIERKAQKQARKEAAKTMSAAAAPGSPANYELPELEATTPEGYTVSTAQLQANRRNSLLSTGPLTPEGKLRSAGNALKTGLTGRTVLLPNEDAALYEHHVQSFFAELKPVGDRETELVQSIADSKWRLARIPSLEFGLYALGRIQLAEEFQNLPKAEAAALIEAKTFLLFQRQLNNLSIQESRLRRQCEKDTADLLRLQQLRAAAEKVKPATPPKLSQSPLEIGFEFSNAELDALEDHLGLDPDLLPLPEAA